MSNKDNEPENSLIQFPCDFTIKVFGLSNAEFEGAALSIVYKHAPNLSGRALQTRSSKNGNYLALSITVFVDSKEQLDTIYQELSSSPHILMVL
jgi:putative lipoic acid-binding regulatory protein